MPSTCPSLLVTTDSATTRPLSSYQVSHRMCLDTEELALRSAIYASLADSMVASVIEELSPKDERSKLLREKLAIIQEAQVSAVSAGFAAASNLQLLKGLITVRRELRQQHPSDLLSGAGTSRERSSRDVPARQQITILFFGCRSYGFKHNHNKPY